LIAALSTIGISISINPHLQAAAISLLAILTLLLIFKDFRTYRKYGPLFFATLASVTLIGMMYIHFNKVIESFALLVLFIAALWSWQLKRRAFTKKPGL
jgi:predicted membrane protein